MWHCRICPTYSWMASHHTHAYVQAAEELMKEKEIDICNAFMTSDSNFSWVLIAANWLSPFARLVLNPILPISIWKLFLPPLNSNSFYCIFSLYNIVLVFPYINMNPPQVYTCPHPEPPSRLPPRTISMGHPRAPAPSILYPASDLDWRFVSYMILYRFQCHSPKSSHSLPLPQSPKDCSILLCLFCCLAYRVIITIFLNSIYMR